MRLVARFGARVGVGLTGLALLAASGTSVTEDGVVPGVADPAGVVGSTADGDAERAADGAVDGRRGGIAAAGTAAERVARVTDAVEAAVASGSRRLLVTHDGPVTAETAPQGAITPAAADEPSRVQVLEVDGAADATAGEVARELAARDDVLDVEPDVRIDLAEVPSSRMWGLHNSGQVIGGQPGRRGVDSRAEKAWSRTTGEGVTIASIDTGVDVRHPLLEDQLWTNRDESANGSDDDGNGYADDVHGYNFVGDSARLYESASVDAHGTHVAGVLAGEPHSSSGVSGVAPGAELMVLKFMDGDSGWSSDAIEAIRYAVDNGADVINASWSSPIASTALRTAIQEAGIPFVAAAGNDGADMADQPTYPSAFDIDEVISVAAVDNAGDLAAFSNHGDVVDVGAPGVKIVATLPGGKVGSYSGTSQATPHVAGAVALALAEHPGTGPVEIGRVAAETSKPLDSLAHTTDSGGIVRATNLLRGLDEREARLAEPEPEPEPKPEPSETGATAACPEPGLVPFLDVSATNPHRDAIGCLVRAEVVNGLTEEIFGVADGLSRAEAASLLARLLEREGDLPDPIIPPFGDLGDSVHRDAIESLAKMDIVDGTGWRRFDPDGEVNRAQLAALTVRVAEHVLDREVPRAETGFEDIEHNALREEIERAAGAGIVNGVTERRFAAAASVRRDQAASMVGRLFDLLVDEAELQGV